MARYFWSCNLSTRQISLFWLALSFRELFLTRFRYIINFLSTVWTSSAARDIHFRWVFAEKSSWCLRICGVFTSIKRLKPGWINLPEMICAGDLAETRSWDHDHSSLLQQLHHPMKIRLSVQQLKKAYVFKDWFISRIWSQIPLPPGCISLVVQVSERHTWRPVLDCSECAGCHWRA